MLLIKNAEIHPMTDEAPFTGDILIEEGRISRIEPKISLDERKLKVIDATGLIALPGLVDAHSHIGGMNFANPDSVDDYNEMTGPIMADVQALYGTDVTSPDFEYARKSGITTVGLTPGSGNVVNGWVFAAKTTGTNVFDMVIKNPVALKIALGGNPKSTYGNRDQTPSTRMAIPQMIRELFDRTLEYMEKKDQAEKDSTEGPTLDAELEAVIPALRKEIPLKIHCTQFDMVTAIELANEYGLDFSIEHAWGASNYLDEIQEGGGSICFGPLGSMKGPGECSLIDIECVVELDKRGVVTSIVTDSPILSIDSLIQHAGEAVRSGLPLERAMRMITINPARILKIDDRVGSLEPGKDGDVVIFRGRPLYETNARVEYTIQDGEIVYDSALS